METKICSLCKVEKLVSEFHLRSASQPWPKSACKECHRERAKQYWRKNPVPLEIQRERNLRKSFGIGIEDYNKLLEQQQNRCAICSTERCNSGRNFAVDHDHKTGRVRGLLCQLCNTALGSFMDSEENLKKAIRYLERTKDGNSKD